MPNHAMTAAYSPRAVGPSARARMTPLSAAAQRRMPVSHGASRTAASSSFWSPNDYIQLLKVINTVQIQCSTAPQATAGRSSPPGCQQVLLRYVVRLRGQVPVVEVVRRQGEEAKRDTLTGGLRHAIDDALDPASTEEVLAATPGGTARQRAHRIACELSHKHGQRVVP